MSDLEELKSLLFGNEKKTLEALQDRLRNPADVAEVLPEAVRLSHQGDPSLVNELQDPVAQCVKRSFKQTPQEYVDVLYPVMGPAIRKSISQALKAFAQQINQTMEYSLSIKGLSWRLRAFRSGVPFSDFVMQQTLQYRVEQAYLISRENGLLITHVHNEASLIKDGDAVSAMFTAIQDFVKDSFSADPNSRLEMADLGEFTLWGLHGPHAVIVCVIRGVPPQSLRTDLNAILERIHFRFHDALRSYTGDPRTLAGVESELMQTLTLQAQEEQKPRRFWIVLAIAFVVLGLVLGRYIHERWQHHQHINNLASVIEDTPGIYLGGIDYQKGQYILQGLRDPLAANISAIGKIAGIPPEHLVSKLQPYQSLDSEIILLRVEQELAPPKSISLSVIGNELRVRGHANEAWRTKLISWQSLNRYDLTVTTSELVVDQTNATETEDLTEQTLLNTEVAKLDKTMFYFVEGVTLHPEDKQRLIQFASSLKSMYADARRLGKQITLSVVGITDRSGSIELNESLSNQRAFVVSEMLRNEGLDHSSIYVRKAEPDELFAEHRGAMVELKLETPEE